MRGLNEGLFLSCSFDFNTNTETTLGSHNEAIRCVGFSEELGMNPFDSWDWPNQAGACGLKEIKNEIA